MNTFTASTVQGGLYSHKLMLNYVFGQGKEMIECLRQGQWYSSHCG